MRWTLRYSSVHIKPLGYDVWELMQSKRNHCQLNWVSKLDWELVDTERGVSMIYFRSGLMCIRPLKLDFVFSVTRPRYENCATFDNQKSLKNSLFT